MSVNLNLNRTNFQAQVRSKPLRENEIDIENAVNDLQSQITSLATGATATYSEIVNARDYHSVLRDRLRSASKANYNTIISGGATTINGGDPQKVDVAAGEAIVDGIACKWVSQTSGTISYTTSNTRYDVVVINNDNSLSIVAGTESATPVFPTVSNTQKSIYVLLIGTASVALFYDMRSMSDTDIFDGTRTEKYIYSDAGIIIPFAGSFTAPLGYLFCDGTSYLRSAYQRLFAVIGTSWGSADGTHFNVPDLRGMFLRGHDNGATVDPDAATRTAIMPGGATGDNVGSAQASANLSHAHTDSGHTHRWPQATTGTGTPNYPNPITTGEFISSTDWPVNTGNADIQADGGSEARPKNVYVKYIIKY